MISTQQPPVIPRPLHNEDATLRSLARQILADLDNSRELTPLPTATVELLLTKLCDLLEHPIEAQQQVASNRLIETTSNPQLAERWWRREGDEE